jgi:hypothetical protein
MQGLSKPNLIIINNLRRFFMMTTIFRMGAGIPLSAGVGYLYGALFNVNKKIATQAFAIGNFTVAVLDLINEYANKKNPIGFYATRLVGYTVLGMIQIAAFRRLNLIATLGTVVFSLFLATAAANNLTNLNKALQVRQLLRGNLVNGNFG